MQRQGSWESVLKPAFCTYCPSKQEQQEYLIKQASFVPSDLEQIKIESNQTYDVQRQPNNIYNQNNNCQVDNSPILIKNSFLPLPIFSLCLLLGFSEEYSSQVYKIPLDQISFQAERNLVAVIENAKINFWKMARLTFARGI